MNFEFNKCTLYSNVILYLEYAFLEFSIHNDYIISKKFLI